VRFLLGWFLFTFGPGVAVAGRLTRDLDGLRRMIVLLGVGSAATALLIDILGRVNLVPTFPYVAAALTGSGLTAWCDGLNQRSRTEWKDAAACAGIVLLAIGLGAGVFGHRP